VTGILMTASNVTAVYAADSGQDVPAVDNVTLEVPEGQIVGLAGESGCGKTTLGNALAMIANPPLYVVAGSMRSTTRRSTWPLWRRTPTASTGRTVAPRCPCSRRAP
jgi:ABC-type glutathione transport system ATPase component